MNLSSPWILALDVPSREEALEWVKRLYPQVGVFKIGMQLFYRHGPQIVKAVQDQGASVFLDLKLHDIPHTVARACESVVSLEVDWLTVHLSGGPAMIEAAQHVVKGSRTQLLGVTALTSLDADTLSQIYPGLSSSPSQWAVHLAQLAEAAQLAGVVCSAWENRVIRKACGERLQLVNPGIRPAGSSLGDQKRVMTPKEALESGANYLVIGRPVLEAPDPVAMVKQLAEEVACASRLPA